METMARCRYLRSSAQKLRLVVNMIRGQKVLKALDLLNYSNKKSSDLVKKTLLSAVSNAKYNNGSDVSNLEIIKAFVDNGPSLKRMMPRAKGRSDRIIKRTSHLTIIVSDKN